MQEKSTNDEIIPLVQSHLRHIASASLAGTATYDLRVASNSLRFLLCQDGLQRGWRMSGHGGPITLSAMCIDAHRDDAMVFCGGGDLIQGIPVSFAFNATLVRKTLDLDAYVNRTCAILDGVKISTRELVNFVANRLGGSHYDPSGKSSKAKAAYDALQRLEAGTLSGLYVSAINGVNQTHHELLSIAQTLLTSPEVRKLYAMTVK